MKVIIFGATGMVGQGVLRECLLDPVVTEVLAVGRTGTGRQDPKLRELVRADLAVTSADSAVEAELTGYDACFFCLGVSSAGMNEEAYRRITYDLTLAVADTLARINPGSVFVYVSGQGTNATGRAMWARVKGATENALLDKELRAYMFRPGIIQPRFGAGSKTRLYRAVYVVATPLFPLLRWLTPSAVTATDTVGRAMIAVARNPPAGHILETPDINRAGTPG
jgi:uncharacterized protein YbjT (DUF2867 family)